MKKSIILIILISFLIAGCINQSDSNNKKEDLNRISTPTIYINKEDHLSIVWVKHDGDFNNLIDIETKNYPRFITIFDDGEQILKPNEILDFPMGFYYHNFVIDTKGNYHFLSLKIKNSTEDAIYYTKFDNNLIQLIPEKQLTVYTRNKGFPELAINSNDEIIIIWEQPSDEGEIFFKKIDNNGNNLINTIDLSNDQNNIDTEPFVLIDANNTIYITWDKKDISNYYMKLSNTGEVLVNATPLEDVAVFPGYPVVRDDLGNLLYLGDYGVVDSSNNIHIYSQEFEAPEGVRKNLMYNKLDRSGNKLIENQTIYMQFRHDPQLKIDSLDNIHLVWEENNHIYYTKLDDDGNKLIDRMKIV